MDSFDIHLSQHEISDFLEQIKIKNTEPCYDLLKNIVKNFIQYVPFQNISMLSEPRVRPSPSKIKSDMLSGLGGLCTVRNPFLYCLLKSMNFEVKFVSSTMNEDDCHISLIVDLDDPYWVDVGNGYPYFEPIKLGDESVVDNWFFSYKLREENNRFYVEHYSTSREQWVINHYFVNESVPYSKFDRMHLMHYTIPGWGPFLVGLRVNRFWESGGIILRDDTATTPDGKFIVDDIEKIHSLLGKWFEPEFLAKIDLEKAIKNLKINKEEMLENEN